MIFVAAATMLVSLAAILIVNLSGAIDTLMTQAKTPLDDIRWVIRMPRSQSI